MNDLLTGTIFFLKLCLYVCIRKVITVSELEVVTNEG